MGNPTLVRVKHAGKRFYFLYNKHAHVDVEATFARNEVIALRKENENQVCVAKYFAC
jgi:hypothetical protein